MNSRNTTEQELVRSLEKFRDATPLLPGYHYRLMWDFVLQHGIWYTPRAYPPNLPDGGLKMCFGNSILLAATKGYRYVEGFAIMPAPFSPIPMHHAWNLDAFGALIDSTWNNEGMAYLGVEFSLERADDATWEADGSVLNDYHRKWPLFREPWTGEDWNRKWPEQERLRLLRAGRLQEAFELMRSDLERVDSK